MQRISSLALGLLISIVLFWLMQAMMHASHKPQKPEQPVLLSIVQPVLKPAAQPGDNKPSPAKAEPAPEPPPPPLPQPKVEPAPTPKPITPKKPKPAPKKLEPKVIKPTIKPTPVVTPKIETPAPAVSSPAANTDENAHKTVEKHSTGGVSSNLVPLERVQPKYPRRAAERHIEGWVKVEFTVTASGEVENANVVASEPPETFDDAALDAIEQWRFKEKMVDGQAVSQRAVQTLQFKLTE